MWMSGDGWLFKVLVSKILLKPTNEGVGSEAGGWTVGRVLAVSGVVIAVELRSYEPAEKIGCFKYSETCYVSFIYKSLKWTKICLEN